MLCLIRKDSSDRAFTLIELLVVIVIIGILSAIAIPIFLHQRQKGWDTAVQSDLRNAATSEEAYLTDHGSYTRDMAVLEGGGFVYSAASNYSGGAAITAEVHSGNSYCLNAQSAAGHHFSFGSASGLQNVGAGAKATDNDGTCG